LGQSECHSTITRVKPKEKILEKDALSTGRLFRFILPSMNPPQLWRIAARKLDQLDSVRALDELQIPPGNRLETLKGSRTGQFSIRINQQYRICFVWTDSGPGAVEIVDYH
jgi:toxin HigB-1